MDSNQCPDQAGFRKEFSTTDHLMAASLIIEKAQEWHIQLWVAAIDFAKAFDSIEHEYIWQALKDQGVAPGYIHAF